MSDISVVKYSPKHKKRLLNFLSFHWDDLTSDERKNRFEWRYENNPYTDSPMCYLALDGKKIVGHRGFVVQKFKLKGKEYYIATPADSVVHPDHRRQGVFSKIVEYSEEDLRTNSDVRLILSTSSNKVSTSAELKYGYIPIGKREYMYLISVPKILKSLVKAPSPLKEQITIDKNGLKIEITKDIKSNHISNMMNHYMENDKIRNVRDEEFYNWIYSDKIHEYIFAYCIKDDKLVSYLALRKNSTKFYTLMEYGYLNYSYLKLIISEISTRMSLPVVRAYTFTRTVKEINDMSNIGFRRGDDIFVRALKFFKGSKDEELPGALIKSLSRVEKEDDFIVDGKDLRSSNSWSLFPSDIH